MSARKRQLTKAAILIILLTYTVADVFTNNLFAMLFPHCRMELNTSESGSLYGEGERDTDYPFLND